MRTLVADPLRKVSFLVMLGTLGVAAATSQGQPGGVGSAVDTFVVIEPARSIDEIKKDVEVLDAYRVRAKARIGDLKEQSRKVETEIEAKEKSIDLLEAREDAADKEKKSAEVAALKAQIEGEERMKELLELRKDLFSAETSAAEAVVDYAAAAQDMYDKEIGLAQKQKERREQPGVAGAKASVAAGNRVLLELETSVLQAQIAKLSKQEKMLSREREVAEVQLKIAEMQAKFLSQ
jgi:hypothetical protein